MNNIPYKGVVTPNEAWNFLESDNDAVIVDVRTAPEWAFVGVPDLSSIGNGFIEIPWRIFPKMELNDNFVMQLEKYLKSKNQKIFFLCKTGVRSHEAAIAMENAGYENCYNIQNGFEGDADENKQRGNINGWKGCKLPWEQK